MASNTLLPYSARKVVWAVESTAKLRPKAGRDWKIPSFLTFRTLEPDMIVRQIEKLATFARDRQASEGLMEHLFVACCELSRMLQNPSQVQHFLQPLADIAWAPV